MHELIRVHLCVYVCVCICDRTNGRLLDAGAVREQGVVDTVRTGMLT